MPIEKITEQINPKSIQTFATSLNWGKVESPDKFDILISQNFDKFAQSDVFSGGKFIKSNEAAIEKFVPEKETLFSRIIRKIFKK